MAKIKAQSKKITLPNGCWMSYPTVSPSDYKTCKKDALKKDWSITYRFFDSNYLHDDQYRNGKQIRIRGLANLTTLEDRREGVKQLISVAINDHLVDGYNPIAKKYIIPKFINSDIPPETTIIKALELARLKLTCCKKMKNEIRLTIEHMAKAIKFLSWETLPITEVKRKHIRQILDNMHKVKNFSNYQYNAYRRDLGMLFSELLELEAVDYNPIRDLKKRKVEKKIRDVLTPEQRKQVDAHLLNNHYNFWRYTQIFFHSGRRTTELLNVKLEDVDLPNQRYKLTEKKGSVNTQKWCIIKNVALPLWTEIVQLAKANDYIFSYDLIPGPLPNAPIQISKRWRNHVKKPLGITADFYSLKHSNTDDIAAMHGIKFASEFVGHTNIKTTKIYAIGQGGRIDEEFKQLDNRL
jgi:integrase